MHCPCFVPRLCLARVVWLAVAHIVLTSQYGLHVTGLWRRWKAPVRKQPKCCIAQSQGMRPVLQHVCHTFIIPGATVSTSALYPIRLMHCSICCNSRITLCESNILICNRFRYVRWQWQQESSGSCGWSGSCAATGRQRRHADGGVHPAGSGLDQVCSCHTNPLHTYADIRGYRNLH